MKCAFTPETGTERVCGAGCPLMVCATFLACFDWHFGRESRMLVLGGPSFSVVGLSVAAQDLCERGSFHRHKTQFQGVVSKGEPRHHGGAYSRFPSVRHRCSSWQKSNDTSPQFQGSQILPPSLRSRKRCSKFGWCRGC